MGFKVSNRRSFADGGPEKPWTQPSGTAEGQGGKVNHVSTPSNTEPSDQTRVGLRSDESREAGSDLHKDGKVNELVEKLKNKETTLDDRAWVLIEVKAVKSTDM
nr:hypothetical protein CFP56_76590 [Quercus suber]